MRHNDYEQRAGDVVRFFIVVAVWVIISIVLMFHTGALKARGQESVHVNMNGWYDFEKIEITDSYGNVFETSWKEFYILLPEDPEYMVQVDVHSSYPFKTFEPYYAVGSYHRVPDYQRRISPTHYRCVLFLGLMVDQYANKYRKKELREALNSSVNEYGEINTINLSPD